MSKVAGYSLFGYGAMIDCEPRMGTYAAALRAAVTPDCTVIDIGAAFGIFAILACKYGAGRVIAIEPDPSIDLVMPLAQANGCADRIEVFKGLSTDYIPDAPADVIVSDLRGTVPLFQTHITTISDARTRLLKPGGAQLPEKDTLHIGLVRSERAYRPISHPWMHNSYDVDLSPALRYVTNSREKVMLAPEEVVSAAVPLVELDYRSITDPNVDTSVVLALETPGPVHGLVVWFDAQIAPGFSYSNAPGQPPLVYDQMLLPFECPVDLPEGAVVEVRFRARLIDGEYIFGWDSDFRHADGSEVRAGMRQSTFKGHFLPAAQVAQHGASRVPAPTRDMEVERSLLSLVDGVASLQTIAEQLLAKHPDAFSDYKSALDRATKAVLRFGSVESK